MLSVINTYVTITGLLSSSGAYYSSTTTQAFHFKKQLSLFKSYIPCRQAMILIRWGSRLIEHKYPNHWTHDFDIYEQYLGNISNGNNWFVFITIQIVRALNVWISSCFKVRYLSRFDINVPMTWVQIIWKLLKLLNKTYKPTSVWIYYYVKLLSKCA